MFSLWFSKKSSVNFYTCPTLINQSVTQSFCLGYYETEKYSAMTLYLHYTIDKSFYLIILVWLYIIQSYSLEKLIRFIYYDFSLLLVCNSKIYIYIYNFRYSLSSETVQSINHMQNVWWIYWVRTKILPFLSEFQR